MAHTHENDMGEKHQNIAAADPAIDEKLATKLEHHEEIVDDAAAASANDHNMGVMEALRTYPVACMFSMIFSTAIVMEGFDLTMINSFYGKLSPSLPAFQKRFGDLQPGGDYLISPAWQTGLSNAVQVGSIIGLLINGWACDKFGYRKTIGLSLILITAFVSIPFSAKSIEVLLIGELLCGLPWGVFQTLTTAYAAEICPLALRPFLTTYVNLCWVMGQFISSGVLKGVSGYSVDNQWAYRIPFGLQWMWPIPIFIAVCFAPESPWYLVRSGKQEEAKASLERLGNKNPSQSIAAIIHTNEVEKVMHEGQTYFDCFRGTNLRRTEIVCMVWMIQTICGSGFIGFSTVFFEQAGLSVSNAFSLSLGNYALGAFGRRELYLYGLAAMTFVLIGVGGTGFTVGSGGSWAAGALVIFYSFLYQFTVGPVCYCLVAEIPSTRLRAKSVVLARISYNIVGIINNTIFPRMLSPISWNWGRKAGFFWAGGCLLSAIWTFYRLPEAKGRTYAELDVLFDDRISARNFKSTAVELFKDGKDTKTSPALEYSHGGGH
ncbi:hypothetical protein RQP46_000023 [Phenoliferia psychrophenolica]